MNLYERRRRNQAKNRAVVGAYGTYLGLGTVQGIGARAVMPHILSGKGGPGFLKLRKAMGVQPGRAGFRRLQPDFPNAAYGNPAATRSHAREINGLLSKTERGVRSGRGYALGRSPRQLAVAHELGHAKFQQGRAGRALGITGLGRLRGPLALGAVGAGALADPDSKLSKAAPWLAGAASVPLLAEEAGASINGYRGLKRAGASRKTLARYLGRMAPAYGTYLGAAAVPVAAVMAARHIRKRSKVRGDSWRWAGRQAAKGLGEAAKGAAGFAGGMVAQRIYAKNKREVNRNVRAVERAVTPKIRKAGGKFRKALANASDDSRAGQAAGLTAAGAATGAAAGEAGLRARVARRQQGRYTPPRKVELFTRKGQSLRKGAGRRGGVGAKGWGPQATRTIPARGVSPAAMRTRYLRMFGRPHLAAGALLGASVGLGAGIGGLMNRKHGAAKNTGKPMKAHGPRRRTVQDTEDFNPRQPRDRAGRFGSGGGGKTRRARKLPPIDEREFWEGKAKTWERHMGKPAPWTGGKPPKGKRQNTLAARFEKKTGRQLFDSRADAPTWVRNLWPTNQGSVGREAQQRMTPGQRRWRTKPLQRKPAPDIADIWGRGSPHHPSQHRAPGTPRATPKQLPVHVGPATPRRGLRGKHMLAAAGIAGMGAGAVALARRAKRRKAGATGDAARPSTTGKFARKKLLRGHNHRKWVAANRARAGKGLLRLGVGGAATLAALHAMGAFSRRKPPQQPPPMPQAPQQQASEAGRQPVRLDPETIKQLRNLHGYAGSMELRQYGQAMGGVF